MRERRGILHTRWAWDVDIIRIYIRNSYNMESSREVSMVILKGIGFLTRSINEPVQKYCGLARPVGQSTA